MFEKEAEEWWNNEYSPSLYDNVSEVWQKGAEFGYNKGYHDAEEHYMNVIDKAKEIIRQLCSLECLLVIMIFIVTTLEVIPTK